GGRSGSRSGRGNSAESPAMVARSLRVRASRGLDGYTVGRGPRPPRPWPAPARRDVTQPKHAHSRSSRARCDPRSVLPLAPALPPARRCRCSPTPSPRDGRKKRGGYPERLDVRHRVRPDLGAHLVHERPDRPGLPALEVAFLEEP